MAITKRRIRPTDMNRFHSAREAKEFLVSRIVEESQQEGIPLSEVERQMLYFSETDWTLRDMDTISDQFDREYDQDDYEKKIAGLAEGAYKRACKESGDEYGSWWDAIHLLSRQDHYILVMISQAGLRPRGDQLRLLGAGLAIAAFLVCFMFLWASLGDRYGIDFGKHLPSRDDLAFLIWVGGVCLGIAYLILRFFVGGKKFDDFVSKMLRRLTRISHRAG